MINSKFLLAAEKFLNDYLTKIDLKEDFFIDEFSTFEITEFLQTIGVLNLDMQISIDFRYPVSQQILLEYLKKQEFIWLNRCFAGRRVLIDSLDNESLNSLKFKSCINESGVGLENNSENTLRWWNELYDFFRSKNEKAIASYALDFEFKTKEFEDKRIKGNSEIVSVEDNGAGYDIRSWIDENKENYLCIEVKSSVKPMTQAKAFISRNQWTIADSLGESFMFYFWCQNQLARLSVEEVRKHVPLNANDGTWEKFNIPMTTFLDAFKPVS